MDLYDQRDSKGQMSFISFKEWFPKEQLVGKERLKSAASKVSSISVAPCNEVWNIGNRIFGLTLVQPQVLSAIQQLNWYAIVFQNVLASNQRAVVEEATYNPLICYENSMWTKKQPATFGSVVGRSSRLPYAQQGLGLSLQLIEHEVVATKSPLSWPLLPALKGAPMDVKFHYETGTPHTMIEVMNHIKVLLKSKGRSEYFFFKMMSV